MRRRVSHHSRTVCGIPRTTNEKMRIQEDDEAVRFGGAAGIELFVFGLGYQAVSGQEQEMPARAESHGQGMDEGVRSLREICRRGPSDAEHDAEEVGVEIAFVFVQPER